MKRKSTIFVLLCATLLVSVAFIAAFPLRRSEASIEASLLQMAPVGSTAHDVLRALEKKGYSAKVDPTGFLKQKPGTKVEVVGVASIRVLLGEYRMPLVRSVSAFWAFDKNERLIEVWVWKTTDGL